MSSITLPARAADIWLNSQTQAHLQQALTPIEDARNGAPVALLFSAQLDPLIRIDPITQVICAGSGSELSPDPRQIMDLDGPDRAGLSLAATALHSDAKISRILNFAREMRRRSDSSADVYLTRDAMLVLNPMGEWDQVIGGSGAFAEAALRSSALCLLPRATSHHQALQQRRAVRGLGALAETDVVLSPTTQGDRRRILDPDLDALIEG